jgi:predicted ATPase
MTRWPADAISQVSVAKAPDAWSLNEGAGPIALFGRDEEAARIEDVLYQARWNRSGALVIKGPTGVGKTALLKLAVDRAEGMAVISTQGIEGQPTIPFANLAELLAPVAHFVADLSPPQAAALASALGSGPPAATDRLAIGAALVSLLAAASGEPLLVVVDDVQWMDPSSARALAVAVPRLGNERVAFLATLREGAPSAFDTGSLTKQELYDINKYHTTIQKLI